MKVEEFNFHLPEHLIAQTPLARRDRSRLLVLHRSGVMEHRNFYDLLDFLDSGDTLVLNDTKVIPARLFGKKIGSKGTIEVLLLKRLRGDTWESLVRPGKKAKVGTAIEFGDGCLVGEVKGETEFGGRLIEFSYRGDWNQILDTIGQMPLPPYISTKLEEKERYQTVFARNTGSAAAPTAGLHFTPELLKELKNKGINIAYITLHVGLGTFRPVQVDLVEDHKMHEEFYHISEETATLINNTVKNNKKLIAVGTTCVRTLETVTDEEGLVHPGQGWTNIFIYPGYQFKIVKKMITNFHLPKSSLIMLVSALAGQDKVLKAYEEAVEKGYRFYSFGDAMLII